MDPSDVPFATRACILPQQLRFRLPWSNQDQTSSRYREGIGNAPGPSATTPNPPTSVKPGAMLPWPLIVLPSGHHPLGVGSLSPESTQGGQANWPHTPRERNQVADSISNNIQNEQICVQSFRRKLGISNCLILQTELQKCQP